MPFIPFDYVYEIQHGWTPDACGYENNVIQYDWGSEWDEPVEFILATLVED